ncbi:MAG TPA: M42 family metallopeptidase [Christensenellaceae bacterium]|jgi:putative aminopeptidase FrvX|nr:M42 family metallopeptidase [Christensenellaceae bacterium]
MQPRDFLKEVTAIPGLSGNERKVAEYIRDKWEPLTDEVSITPTNSVIARKKGKGPSVLFAAHLDEIGLMVSRIEDDGSLRMVGVGGVDPRILPSMRVSVLAKSGRLTGVIGAKAPHLLTEDERNKNYTMGELHIDLGMDASKVKELVQVGDEVQLEYRFTELLNNRVAVKTCDDRACVAILYRAMQLLQDMRHDADIYFLATCQEEVGAFGAWQTSYQLFPDYAVALDVCHAATPDADPTRTHDLTAVVASAGPYLNPVLRRKLMEVAEEQNIKVQTSVVPRYTATDADEIAISRSGIPTILIELPLKYMHTSVELIDTHVIDEAARLLACFAQEINASWEDELWT